MANLRDVLAALKESAMATPAAPGVEPIEYAICPDAIGDRASSSFTTRCVYCKGSTLVTLLTDKYRQWKGGAHVQNVWPGMPIGDREILTSGTHSPCFDKLYEEPDDEG